MLAQKLSAIDYIPGIDLPSDREKKQQLASQERELREAEQQNAEFDEEADRLFGDVTESEEASDEDVEEEEEEANEMSELVSEASGSPQRQSAENSEDQSSLPQQGSAAEPGNTGLDAASELHASHGMASIALDKPPEGNHEPPSPAVLDHLQ